MTKLARLKSVAKTEGWGQYIQTKSDEQALLEGCRFEPSLGEHVCRFFKSYLRHSKGEWAGKAFELARVQVDDIIMPLFSWVRPDGDGGYKRRFNKTGIWVAKKNFKSTLASGLTLYGLVGDDEPGAEVYCAANARDQAAIVYRESANMVDASPSLRKDLTCIKSSKTITYGLHSWMRALSADASTAEGLNAHWVVVDELHAFDSRGRDFYDALIYSGAARKQPMFMVISTAGDDMSGIGFEVYTEHREILDGHRIDTSTFAYIAETKSTDDPGNPATWRKANPMMGITISEDEMREAYEAAKGSPRKMSRFRRYRLNQWVEAADPWLDMDKWVQCAGDVDLESLAGCPCAGGFDYAPKHDLSALSLCFPLEDGVFAFHVHFWLPGDDIIAREKRDRCEYRMWARDGWLTLTEGNTTDVPTIEEYIVAASVKYDIRSIGFDPHLVRVTAQRLQDVHGIEMVEMQQGRALSEPSKAFEDLVKSKKMVHFDNPVMRQQAAQVKVKTCTGGEIYPVKSLDRGKRWFKIDGIIAGVMSVGRAMSMGDSQDPYADRGVLTLDSL